MSSRDSVRFVRSAVSSRDGVRLIRSAVSKVYNVLSSPEDWILH